MAITIANILVGEGVLKLAPTTAGTLVDVGATQDGAEIAWEPSMVDIEVDQFGDAAKVVQSKVKSMLKTKMAEATLQNLAFAWGYATNLGSDTVSATNPGVVANGYTFQIGIHPTYPNERKLTLQGHAPGTTAQTDKPRTYSCNRVVSYAASSHHLKRAEAVTLPVEFRILPDPTQTGQEYGTIIDTP